MVKICVAGATGWAGRAVAEAITTADGLTLQSAVCRKTDQNLSIARGSGLVGVTPTCNLSDALQNVDVLVDYTSHEVVKTHTLTAIEQGISVVIGSSGLTQDDFVEIDRMAREYRVGVIAAGNFSLTAAMAQATALMAARYLPSCEVIDYGSAGKRDAPSGTAQELAERLSEVERLPPEVPIAQVYGIREARGAKIEGVQVHSVRLPGFVLSTEVIFGLPDERLSIRHDAGGTPTPYVAGTLLAIRAMKGRIGLTRGLDTLLMESVLP